jgi:hypothetical protein
MRDPHPYRSIVCGAIVSLLIGAFVAARLIATGFGSGWLFGRKFPWQIGGLAAVISLPLAIFVVSLISTLRARRSLPSQCSFCGYDLTGNRSGICPECGQRI